MRDLKKAFVGLTTFALFVFPIAASAASVTVQNITPGTTVVAKSNVWFNIVPSGFTSATYHISDSFANSSASLSNIDPGGKFSWTPVAYDAGTHVFTISITDNDGNSASVTQTITVMPPPSIKIANVAPGLSVMPGTKLTFTVQQDGFTNPTYMVGDTFSSPSISGSNIDSTGSFSWTPDQSQNGEHTINVYATDNLGHSSTASLVVRVGAGPSITIGSVTPTGNVNPGQTVSFAVSATNYSPTAFSVYDPFSGTSASNNNINLSGMFAWTPLTSDAGVHNIVITGQVGAFGASASTTRQIVVLGPNGQVPVAAQTTVATTTTATSTGTNPTLVALQAQLAFLQSKMSGQTGSASVPAAALPVYTFTSYLKPGMSGDEVRKLQDFLKERGFLTATPNGYYGVGTTDAVKKFQTENGLDSLGVFGPATRAIVNAMLSSTLAATTQTVSPAANASKFVFEHFMGVGDDDPDVLELQKRLVSLGYLSSAPTGYYGSVTEAAVKKFQAAKGLPVTGYAGRDTRLELNR